MIKNISYSEAINIRFLSTQVVKIFVFKEHSLPCCRAWEAEVLEKCAEKFNMFEWYLIEIDKNNIPFPPVTIPTFHFVIPGAENLHFKRQGNVDITKLERECARFLRIQNGEYFGDVLSS
jgi:hypothetical protein